MIVVMEVVSTTNQLRKIRYPENLEFYVTAERTLRIYERRGQTVAVHNRAAGYGDDAKVKS